MALSGKRLETIGEADIRALVENRVPESIRLEFKRDLVGTSDDAKKEFLKDVCALANSRGGDLVFGITEDDGVAAELSPISNPSMDAEIRRLASMIADGLEPRLTTCRIAGIRLSDGGAAIVVRVPLSWNRPHRVAFKGHRRFYRRRDRSVYEMDVSELRAAFAEAGEAQVRLLAFRDARLLRIRRGEPMVMKGSGRLILHLVPLRPEESAVNIEKAYFLPDAFDPPGNLGRSRRVTFDGLLISDNASDGVSARLSLVQLFRDGSLEVVRGDLVHSEPRKPELRWLLSGRIVEVVNEVPRFLRSLAAMDVLGPFAALLSLLDVDSTVIEDAHQPPAGSRTTCDRVDLLLPMALLEDPGDPSDVFRNLRAPLDALWNDFGYLRCPLFTDQGEWRAAAR